MEQAPLPQSALFQQIPTRSIHENIFEKRSIIEQERREDGLSLTFLTVMKLALHLVLRKAPRGEGLYFLRLRRK